MFVAAQTPPPAPRYLFAIKPRQHPVNSMLRQHHVEGHGEPVSPATILSSQVQMDEPFKISLTYTSEPFSPAVERRKHSQTDCARIFRNSVIAADNFRCMKLPKTKVSHRGSLVCQCSIGR